MSTPASPIGIFDSGIGGLTVVREVIRQLPHERIIYFGDTARVPYGPKSPDTVRRYSHEIGQYLTSQDVKAIVIACNTATAHALPMLQREQSVPVIGVVEPGAKAGVAASRRLELGVIGTAGTIRLARLRNGNSRDRAERAHCGACLPPPRAARRGRVARYRSDTPHRPRVSRAVAGGRR